MGGLNDVPTAERPHWYRIYIGSCPVCQRDCGSRERVYGERPERREDRVVYLSDRECYDYCDV